MDVTLSSDEIFHEVVVATRDLYPALSDLREIRRPGWHQIITPGGPAGVNQVLHAELEGTDAEIEGAIDDAIASFRTAFRWFVGPASRPADLAERLARRGLAGHVSLGMARATAAGAAPNVVRVDDSTLGAYTAVTEAGWGASGPLGFHRQLLDDPRYRLFLAFDGDVPAATASYASTGRSAHLLGGVVLPAYRRRGLYRALVAARLADAAAAGLPLATSHARASTSAPILAALGFDTVCELRVFTGSPA